MATLRVKIKDGRKYWQLDYMQGGKRFRPSLGPCDEISKAQANIELRAKQLELQTGKRVFIAAPEFGAFRTDYLDWHAKEYPDAHERVSGILNSEHITKAFVGLSLADDEIVEKIAVWRAERKEAVAHNTVVKEFRTLSAYFARAIQWNKGISENPCKATTKIRERRGKPPVWYTSAQAAKLYQELHGYTWQLACNTGMRRSELLACEPSWFDLKRKELTIVSQEDEDDGERTKSGHFRTVPLNPSAIAAFQGLMEDRDDQPYVLRQMTKPSLSRAFKIDMRRAGITTGSLHSTRHTYAAHLCQAGVPLRTVKELMGHESIATTMRYAHLCPDHLREQALKIAV